MNKTLLIKAAIVLAFAAFVAQGAGRNKRKKSKKQAEIKFDSKTLKCLVCQGLSDEFSAAIHKIDPKKMIDTGTFRINEKGEQKRSVIPFARSQVHLIELFEKICENFEDYAQAKDKATGEATIIRMTTPQGNMNPRFGKVDLVPDDDLNSRLKFYCQEIVEDNEEDWIELLADEEADATMKEELCVNRSKLCKADLIRDEL